jgi:hypothetical protein
VGCRIAQDPRLLGERLAVLTRGDPVADPGAEFVGFIAPAERHDG